MRTRIPALLGGVLGVLALQTGASAHFIWLESTPTPGAVQAYFGEYPEERSGKELLDKVVKLKAYGVQGGARQELKATRGDNFFRYETQAPVAAAHLDYGVMAREGTPPYLLRYETVLLRGQGKALGAADISRLSKVPTGLSLVATVEPAGDDKLKLRVTRDGKPVAAEVTRIAPAPATEKEKTDSDGVVLMPLQAGPYHLRIMAQDDKPTTLDGKEAKFTRTYLSVMFDAAGKSAAAKPGAVLAAAQGVDAEAMKLLDDAHVARANWKKDFPGFTADAVYSLNGKTAKGTITVKPDFNIEYNLGDSELEKALRPSFGSLVLHRRAGGDAPQFQATWRDSETHPLGRAINLNDPNGGFFRIRDRQIMQVNRTMGSQRFINNVLENEETKLGFLPRAWTVTYYDKSSNAMLRNSTTRVTWKWIGDVFVPATLETINAHNEGTDVSQLVLMNAKLLK